MYIRLRDEADSLLARQARVVGDGDGVCSGRGGAAVVALVGGGAPPERTPLALLPQHKPAVRAELLLPKALCALALLCRPGRWPVDVVVRHGAVAPLARAPRSIVISWLRDLTPPPPPSHPPVMNPPNGSAPQYNFKPFNETKYKADGWQNSSHAPRQYTPEEHRRILLQLDKVLGPEYVSFRPGGGGQKVSYIEGWRALNLANEIFGFNGWSLELIGLQVDYFDTHGNTGRILMGLLVVVRITIRDGTYHEDFGYGYIENAKNKAMAFEKCKKEAFTDGLKRCLRCFGNVLGNCLYDRTIIPKIQRVKLPPAELEYEDFHRDPLVVARERRRQGLPPAAPAAEAEAPAGAPKGAPASGAPAIVPSGAPASAAAKPTTHPVAPEPSPPPSVASRPPPRSRSLDHDARRGYDLVDDFDDSFVFSDDIQPLDDDKMSQNDGLDDYELQMLLLKNRQNGGADDPAIGARTTYAAPPPAAIPQQVSFVSAKAADAIQKDPALEATKLAQFDPTFVLPNIRRTVDPSRSTPIKRAPAASPALGKRMLGMPPQPGKRQHTQSQSQLLATGGQGRAPPAEPIATE